MTTDETAPRWPGNHPLVDSIGRATALNDFFAIPLRYPDQDRWIEAESLFLGDDQRLRDLIVAYGRDRWGSENRHLAGSGFIVAYLTRLTYPLISQYLLERRVPNVSLSNLSFHTNDRGIDGTALNRPGFTALPDDPASGHPDAQVVPDEAALYARLKEWLFDSNLELVVPSLHRAARASLKVSWNAVASSCAQVFHRLYNLVEEPDTVVRDAEAFFGDPSSPAYRQVTMEVIEHRGKRGYFARRAGCCLWWRVSKDYCSGCILLPREEQDARFR
ncbi:MAG: IucA/IucC family C-terminal-domain containing protein, partial [Dehalococcoidia bacterium]